MGGDRRGRARAWASGELPMLEDVALGPRTAHDPARGASTLLAYRAWAERAGSQAQAFTGDPAWPDQRRFDRAFERLSLPGFGRAPRFELLVTLGRLGVFEVRPWSLQLSGDALDPTIVASKRVLGIGDPLLLQRRSGDLATGVGVPIEALDLALANWLRPEGERITAPARRSRRGALRDSTARRRRRIGGRRASDRVPRSPRAAHDLSPPAPPAPIPGTKRYAPPRVVTNGPCGPRKNGGSPSTVILPVPCGSPMRKSLSWPRWKTLPSLSHCAWMPSNWREMLALKQTKIRPRSTRVVLARPRRRAARRRASRAG